MNVNCRRKGFTLIEVMIATFLTVIISLLVFQMYRASISTFRRAERELRWLAAFRSAHGHRAAHTATRQPLG